MKTILITAFVGFITLLMWSCKEIFSSPVDIEPSLLSNKGVIFGLLANSDPRDSLFREQVFTREKSIPGMGRRIFSSHSTHSNKGQQKFHKAKISVRSEEKDLPLKYFDASMLPGSLDPFYGIMEEFTPGREYRLSASCDTTDSSNGKKYWAPVSALDTVPRSVSVIIEEAGIKYPDLKKYIAEGFMNIRIEDEPYIRNTYQLEIAVVQSHVDALGRKYDVVIPVNVDGGDDRVSSEVFGDYHHNLIHEAEFNRDGQKKVNFTFHTNHGLFNKEKPVTLVIRFSNLSRHYAEFLNSSRRYFAMGENPFAEPAEIYSNIQNGYGIFAFAARSYDSYEVR